ncbi:MAG: alpha-amylase family glycosyl hydrolase, partial [Opitutales bacterium]
YDVISLDYRQPGLRRYMTDAMKYWVRDVGFDGFRCDVAGFVPLDFWVNVRRELDAIRPVFMLGEWESRDLQARAFDATYAWSWYDSMHAIAMGKTDAGSLYGYYAWNEGFYPRDSFRMLFTSNQDKNSWDGTALEQFGAALPAATVLSFVSEGLPLIYNGQEAGNAKRLKFFEKDPIEWRANPAAELYRRLIVLRKTHPALWSAHWGARMIQVPNDVSALCFVRQQGADKVFAVFNFSPDTKTVRFTGGPFAGAYHDYFTGESVAIKPDTALTLKPWACRVFVP